MVFIVKPVSAQLIKDTDFFGKMDPYVVCTIGHQKQRTKTHQGGGKKPQWFDTLQFQSSGNLMKVQMYDDDLGKDDFIGQGSINLNQLVSNPMRTQNQYVDLICRGKSAGRVLISMEYQGQPIMGGNNAGWGNNNQGGWNNGPNNGGWGNNPNNNGWGNGPNNGWGNNGPNNGWGNNGPNNGWGNNGPNNGWGNNGPNNGPNNGGWGNGPNNGWGNNGPNNGWGNNGSNNGWGNNGPNNGGWGNNGPNNGWGNNAPNNGWSNGSNKGW